MGDRGDAEAIPRDHLLLQPAKAVHPLGRAERNGAEDPGELADAAAEPIGHVPGRGKEVLHRRHVGRLCRRPVRVAGRWRHPDGAELRDLLLERQLRQQRCHPLLARAAGVPPGLEGRPLRVAGGWPSHSCHVVLCEVRSVTVFLRAVHDAGHHAPADTKTNSPSTNAAGRTSGMAIRQKTGQLFAPSIRAACSSSSLMVKERSCHIQPRRTGRRRPITRPTRQVVNGRAAARGCPMWIPGGSRPGRLNGRRAARPAAGRG